MIDGLMILGGVFSLLVLGLGFAIRFVLLDHRRGMAMLRNIEEERRWAAWEYAARSAGKATGPVVYSAEDGQQ